MENELTQMAPEPEPSQASVPSPAAETPPAATPPEAQHVDESPDPAALSAEIEKLREQRKKAEEDAVYWRKQKAQARSEFFRDQHRPPDPPAQPAASAAPEPRVADFSDYDEYVKALTDHRVKQAKAEWETEARQRQSQGEQKQRMEDLQAKMQEGFQRYADFEEVTFDPTATHITPMVVDLLADCDAPADIAYYLARNRVEGVAISRMTPTQAARAIARIEAKLAAGPTQTQSTQQQPRRVSAAPAPIAPIGAGPAGSTKDPEKMTMKEYTAWRESQGARRF